MIKCDKQLFEDSCREHLLEIVKCSGIINKKLTFTQKVLLFDKIKQMPFQEVFNLLFLNEIRDLETKEDRDTKYGAAMTLGGVAGNAAKHVLKTKTGVAIASGAALGTGLLFLYRKVTDPCFLKTMIIPIPSKRKVAKLQCKNNGILRVIEKIRSDIDKCDSAQNPGRCQDKLAFELKKWRVKYQENLEEIAKLRRS